MESFQEIIDAVGVGALARAFGVEESHIRTMKARNSIPPEYWGDVVTAARAAALANISLEALRKMRSARFGRRSPASAALPTESALAVAPESESPSLAQRSREVLSQQLDDARTQLARQVEPARSGKGGAP